jgi:hypothetical protein
MPPKKKKIVKKVVASNININQGIDIEGNDNKLVNTTTIGNEIVIGGLVENANVNQGLKVEGNRNKFIDTSIKDNKIGEKEGLEDRLTN